MNQTVQNLIKAFIGESQARNRYTFYAKIAKKEGYEQIASIFSLTADQEKEHAHWLFKMLQDIKTDNQEVQVQAQAPTVLGNTINNLKAAISGEKFEHTQMYPEYAKVAKKQGYEDIANRLLAIAQAEAHHQERYEKLLAQVKNRTFFSKEQVTEWTCRECGYVFKGKEPPQKCPSCSHPQAYYEIKCEKY
ncbi:MAG: rubrerythrin family protein [Candidatus Moranbacteria bacterium]|nr:rubrerythrin family protein [Candidatus Moranbacteria bacterium]